MARLDADLGRGHLGSTAGPIGSCFRGGPSRPLCRDECFGKVLGSRLW